MKISFGKNISFYLKPWTHGWEVGRSFYWGWFHVNLKWK